MGVEWGGSGRWELSSFEEGCGGGYRARSVKGAVCSFAWHESDTYYHYIEFDQPGVACYHFQLDFQQYESYDDGYEQYLQYVESGYFESRWSGESETAEA